MPCCNVSINKNYKCDKANCICIPTDGRPCICICENKNGDFVRCDECKCSTDDCQCKCDDSKCTCIVTNGADCICICRDEAGNIEICDCSCTDLTKTKTCCKKERSVKSCQCCAEKPVKSFGRINADDGKINFQIIYHNERRNNVKCNCSCTDFDITKSCCKKEHPVKSCQCCAEKSKKCFSEIKDDVKTRFQTQRRITSETKYSCDQVGCICIPTDGKPCICICENKNGDIVRCDDCKCSTDDCQCKCDDSKCTCIVTNGADCICICRDERGNTEICDCSCTDLTKTKTCCIKERSIKSCQCWDEQPVKSFGRINYDRKIIFQMQCHNERSNNQICDCSCTDFAKTKSCCKKERTIKSCQCCPAKSEKCFSAIKDDGKTRFQTQRPITCEMKYSCAQVGCICIPTDGKPCICICENKNGDFVRCDDCKCTTDDCQCKCDDSKCTCIVTNGADCICICRDEAGNIEICDCPCTDMTKTETCCMKERSVKSFQCCAEKPVKGFGRINDDGKINFQMQCRNKKENIEICDCSYTDLAKTKTCCKKDCSVKSCQCCAEKPVKSLGRINNDGKINFQMQCHNERRNNVKYDCSCTDLAITKSCCKKERPVKSCQCSAEKSEKSFGGIKEDGKRNFIIQRRITSEKKYSCNQVGFCNPTDGKPCACICENKNGDTVRCDKCECSSDKCTCKSCDSKYTSIVTKGVNCVCICRNERGNIKICDCSCTDLAKIKSCCKTERSVKSCQCCAEKSKPSFDGIKNDGKRRFQTQRRITSEIKYSCDQVGCICIPTDGKPCICICENKYGDIVRCDDCKCSTDDCQCKCDDSKCTCIVTKGADCVCVYRDERGNIQVCEGSDFAKTLPCCKKERPIKSYECCAQENINKCCGINEDRKCTFQIQKYTCLCSTRRH